MNPKGCENEQVRRDLYGYKKTNVMFVLENKSRRFVPYFEVSSGG